MKRIFVFLWLVILIAPVSARNQRPSNPPRIADLPDIHLRTHRISNIFLSVTDMGVIGALKGRLNDPDTTFPRTPGAEFPARSRLEYLNLGAIWVGGVIDTFNSDGKSILDTLVSVGNDGWWSDVYELIPPRPTTQSIWRDRIVADDEIFATYADTCTDTSLVIPDPVDSIPHIPLGIEINQHTLCWSSPGYNEIFILEYAIENIYNRPIHDVWVGIYYDGDVFYRPDNPNRWPEEGTDDELCGFIPRSSNRGIAWCADNNGQPYGRFDYRSPTGVMGMTLLHPVNGIQTNFNWWVSSAYSFHDWGPRRIENGEDPFPGGGMGTPGGDRAKYKVMTNGEQDYDQAWCAMAHEGWIMPTLQQIWPAHGEESRYLFSFGPLKLAVGQIETVAVALVGGRNLHIDPKNYSDHLRFHETDSASVAAYYEGLDFSDLIAKADSAYAFYQRHYAYMPVGPPANLHVYEWNTDRISLAWSPSWYRHIGEYRIYRRTASGEHARITPDNLRDTTFTDIGLEDNSRYYYVITSVTSEGIEGGRSREMSFNSGQPQTPTGLMATSGNNQVALNWQANEGNDIAGYIIYRALQGQVMFVMDTIEALTYIDAGARNGIPYDYCISAFDTHGNKSFESPGVTCTPMGFDCGILIINMNSLGPYNPDYDSMTAFYQRAIGGHQYTVTNNAPSSLVALSPYSTVIWSKELVGGNSFANPLNTGIFNKYLNAGGKLILEGTRNIVENAWFGDTVSFLPGDFRYDCLNLIGAEYPDTAINSEFVGAWSPLEEMPLAEVDTARANRIIYPLNQDDGRLFGIGVLSPRARYEVLYNYMAVNPDTSQLDGKPVATLHMGTNFMLAILEFPLYYIKEPASIQILQRILDEFGEMGIEDNVALPDKAMLLQNYPNPFNSQTTFEFSLPQAGDVQLDIFNILGEKVALIYDGFLAAGNHSVIWNADRFSSGLYIARLEAERSVSKIKLVLLK